MSDMTDAAITRTAPDAFAVSTDGGLWFVGIDGNFVCIEHEDTDAVGVWLPVRNLPAIIEALSKLQEHVDSQTTGSPSSASSTSG